MRKLIIPAIFVFTIVLNAQPSFEFGQNYQIISVNNVNQKFPYAAFDSNGTLHLVWVHQSGGNLNVYYAQSIDEGYSYCCYFLHSSQLPFCILTAIWLVVRIKSSVAV